MYNQAYEEYMRNVLGYMPSNRDMEYTYRNDYPMTNMQAYPDTVNVEYMYPDIYKIVYPMVKKACASYRGGITKENVEQITMEVFTNVEVNMEAEAQISIQNRKEEVKSTQEVAENKNKPENRNRNFLLRDLIQILVLRELIDGNRQPRPPFLETRPPFSATLRSPFLGEIGSIQPRLYGEENFY